MFRLYMLLFLFLFSPAAASADCTKIPLNDKDHARYLAKNGNATAAYVYASHIQKEKGGNTYDIDEEALEWLKIAAKQGSATANDVLCSKFWFYQKTSGTYIDIPKEQLDWCYNAAKHDSKSAKTALALMYELGVRTKKDNKNAYFWSRLNSKSKQSLNSLAKDLTAKQIEKLEQKISEWKPEEPILDSPNMDVISPWKGAHNDLSLLPVNVAGLICGGEAHNCTIEDQCNELAGIFCPRSQPRYFIADKKTKKIISSCPDKDRGCLDLVPKKWTCGSPRNMPLSKADQDKYPEYKHAVSCGEILGVDQNSAGDGPYYFINKKTGEKIGSCSFWHGKCEPPKEWACGRPSNYGG